jgi:hypothetical protein
VKTLEIDFMERQRTINSLLRRGQRRSNASLTDGASDAASRLLSEEAYGRWKMRLASKASTISGEGVLAEDDIARGTSLSHRGAQLSWSAPQDRYRCHSYRRPLRIQ